MNRFVLLPLMLIATFSLAAEPVEDWNQAFARTDGWTGGDVAGTIDLKDGRVLWVFGDSWIGKIRDGAHVSGAKLVNNAIAIQRIDKDDPTKPPAADALTFHWGPNNAKNEPTAWIVPTPRDDKLETWYWSSGGGALVPTAKGPKLIVFLFEITRLKENDGGVFNFRHVGEAMAIVDNPSDPIEKWQVRQVRIPAAMGAPAERKGRQEPTIHWGQAALVWPVARNKDLNDSVALPYLHVYGMRGTSPLDQHLVLARVPANDFEDFAAWRFAGKEGAWHDKVADAASLAKDLVTEFSVEPIVAENGQPRFLLVQSEPLLGPRIFLRWADTPAGPWSERKEIYTVPDIKKNKAYFTYAAKGHAMLSRPDELLVTYVVNSHDFGAAFRDASIYFPKFLRVKVK